MKKLIIVLSMFLVMNSVASAQEAAKSAQKETNKEMYSCPMHPKEISSKDGECSECGMKLVKKLKNDTSGKGKKTKIVTKRNCCLGIIISEYVLGLTDQFNNYPI